jgi:hypothetical protein
VLFKYFILHVKFIMNFFNVKPSINKRNGQMTFCLPKKKLTNYLKNNFSNIKSLNIKLDKVILK